MGFIDLQKLSERESEQVEWKENVADFESVIRTAVAFANDYSNLGGGYIVCGAEEGKDEYGFQRLIRTGMVAKRCKEVEGRLFSDLREKVDPPIVPILEELPVDNERRILVFIVPASKHAHSFRASGKDSSKYYIRIGRETREARNGLYRELLVRKNDMEPWDIRINPKGSPDNIDLMILGEYLREMNVRDPNKSVEEYLSEDRSISTLAPSLMEKEPLTNTLKPRNFTLLMFGKNPVEFFGGAYTVFSIYRGKDRSEAAGERHEITGNVVQQARKCMELLNAESYTAFDKEDDKPNQLKYPARALHEAVVNCLVHRDYENNQPARITVFNDRIEVYSPGSLPTAVDRSKFLKGKTSPVWRNQSLAYFFNRLQLAQAEGQGIPTIFRLMEKEGCPKPTVDFGSESLTFSLPAHPRHVLMRTLYDVEQEVILGEYELAHSRLSGILKNDPYNSRAIDLFCTVSDALDKADAVLDFLKNGKIDFGKLNSQTIAKISDSLSSIPDDEEAKQNANRLMHYAKKMFFEENHIERFVISLNKLRQSEELISFIDDFIRKNRSFANNDVLLQNRARANMDMAKKYIDTAKNRQGKMNDPKIRAKVWEKARNYLNTAEQDLNLALENTAKSLTREYLKKDMDFLGMLKEIVQKSS